MQTTLRLDDELYREAKMAAAREGVTLTRFLEDALRNRVRLISDVPSRKTKTRLPVSRRRGGLVPGIKDLKEAADAMDRDVLG